MSFEDTGGDVHIGNGHRKLVGKMNEKNKLS